MALMRFTLGTVIEILWCGMLKIYSPTTILSYIFLALLFLGLSGCKVVQTIDSLNGILEEPMPPSEAGKLLQAEYAFYEGNYDLAENLFSTVRSGSDIPLYRNQALYGLASIAIATADNAAELKDGFILLQKWEEPGAETVNFVENPKMMAVALGKQIDVLDLEPEIHYVTTKEEGELARLKQREIEELKKSIRKLEHQISIFEAIDQEIQEKRKPL